MAKSSVQVRDVRTLSNTIYIMGDAVFSMIESRVIGPLGLFVWGRKQG